VAPIPAACQKSVKRHLDMVAFLVFAPVPAAWVQAAARLEASQHRLFPGWGIPSLISFVVWAFYLMYCIIW
jgi:hypothetical protein